MRLRDFQVLKSRRWLPGQIWVRGKSSGGSTCTVLRKIFRDFNLLCGVKTVKMMIMILLMITRKVCAAAALVFSTVWWTKWHRNIAFS
jgi:hypothetical protein